MDKKKLFDEIWKDAKQRSGPQSYINQPFIEDLAYSWFLAGWNLNQTEGKAVIVEEIRKFLCGVET